MILRYTDDDTLTNLFQANTRLNSNSSEKEEEEDLTLKLEWLFWGELQEAMRKWLARNSTSGIH